MSKSVTLLMDLSLPGGRISLRGADKLNSFSETAADVSGSAGALQVIDGLLRQYNITMNDVREVVCTRGPGGYTGIRVALSIVGGFQRALGISAHAYPLFDVLLHDSEGSKSAAAIDAGRNEMIIRIPSVSPDVPFLIEEGALAAELRKHGVDKLFLSSAHYEDVRTTLGDRCRVLNASDNVLRLLFDFHRSGKGKDSDELAPIYGRELTRG